jgi:hypothetical protein
MTGPAHVSPVTYAETLTVVHYIDRGLIVRNADGDWMVREVRIRYRWSEHEGHWTVTDVHGIGVRKMPGTGYLGNIAKKVEGMHPDYRDLAAEYAPKWRPPK